MSDLVFEARVYTNYTRAIHHRFNAVMIAIKTVVAD